jgi:predicted anti-sigma-YlaC factor YlaD
MPDQISSRLGAYLDGELNMRSQIEVQAHLETCSACQAELEELRRLLSLLRVTPQPNFVPASEFKAQFMLQLPRHPVQIESQLSSRHNSLLPWLAPALVLVGWIFIQVTLNLSTLVSIAYQAGFLGPAASWANSDPQQMLWLATAQVLLNGMMSPQDQAGLNFLNTADLFTQNLLISLLLQVGAAVVYWGSLTIVWLTKAKMLWTSPKEG